VAQACCSAGNRPPFCQCKRSCDDLSYDDGNLHEDSEFDEGEHGDPHRSFSTWGYAAPESFQEFFVALGNRFRRRLMGQKGLRYSQV